MIGAIIGDVVGSRFEFNNTHRRDFELFAPNHSRFTDDTIMMVAVAEAILDGSDDYASYIRKWVRKYPHAGYGSRTYEWAMNSKAPATDSVGNGALARAIPVALARKRSWDLNDIVKHTDLAVSCSHDSDEARDYAAGLAHLLVRTLNGEYIDNIQNALCINGYSENSYYHYYTRGVKFDTSCSATLPVAIACFRKAKTFEEAIRLAVSVGGDSDSIASVAGALAGARFGVPQQLVDRVKKYLPDDIRDVVDRYCVKMDALPVPFWADPSTGKLPYDYQFVESGHLFV